MCPRVVSPLSEAVRNGVRNGFRILTSLFRMVRLTATNTHNRHAAMAIRAFNVETATIKDVVRGNVVPGRMRMQWWKDSLAGR